ncbi:hypothetical protein [Nonomuraea typhae]|uniref:hypothetical protein n=1 Tax=Nonomuraea typhae TaxID=2603600 RepID=UPI0012FCDDED|nr:hypothetical protein [Nonomuraea typhae]
MMQLALPGMPEPEPLFVGLDQSYTGFGLIVLGPDTGIVKAITGTWPAKKHGSGVMRLLEIYHWLWKELSPYRDRIEHVVMEGYAYEARFGREQAGELGATVKLALAEALPDPIRYPTIVPPPQLKQFATGRGNASKDDMITAAAQHGFVTKNHNLADAYLCARLAHLAVAGTTNPAQESVLRKLTLLTERHAA